MDPRALFERADGLHRGGNHAQALVLYDELRQIASGNRNVHFNRALVLLELRRPADALAGFQDALKITPEFADAWANGAKALIDLRRHEEACAACERALTLDPRHPSALNNHAVALMNLRRLAEAEAACRRLLELQPGHAEAANNLGSVLEKQSKFAEALESYDYALRLRPDYVDALNNRGIVLGRLGRMEEAWRCFDEAQRIAPDCAASHFAEALLRLRIGDYDAGFKEYEWRWLNDRAERRKLQSQSLWLGQADLSGKSILLDSEQGLGDTLQFVRYAPLVAAKGAMVLLAVQKALVPLVEGMPGVTQVLAAGDAVPQTDFYCPLASLPLAFRTTLESIPAGIPYLAPNPQGTGRWRKELARGGEKLVGICWRGNPEHPADQQRSLTLAELEPLLAVPGVCFISLQKELTPQEQEVASRTALVHPGAAFQETAELIAALDLVVSVDTVWAHWAGALGKPLWVLLSSAPDWRWLLEREDSPWYPSARLFRQAKTGSWEEVIRRVEKGLAKMA
jgi:tetratricopeptide (TPR) repeat protein